MNHNFKPGDLALVIGGKALLGKVVTVNIWINPDDEFLSPSGNLYKYADTNHASGFLVLDATDKKLAIKHPHNLMPLKGEPEPEQAKQTEVVE